MRDQRIENLNIETEEEIVTPDQLKKEFPLSETAVQTVMKGQNTIKAILNRDDFRLLVVVGPCSIHDTRATLEYAKKLKILAEEVSDTLFVVMRTYFEKPRTDVGWQGLLIDPYLDHSYDLAEGFRKGRKLLLEIAELGLPTAGEALDLITPQYVQDLFSWTAIGARTTEAQTHRKMASGLSNAVGFKNTTNGDITTAINAMRAASHPNHFLGVDTLGKVSIIRTKGNPYTHLVLRGGNSGPNYHAESIAHCHQMLLDAGFNPSIMVDCSHANSNKDHRNQPRVLQSISEQIKNGNQSIMGVMLESNLHEGKQKIPQDLSQLKYGVSITDSCISWETTETILPKLRNQLKTILPHRHQHQ